MIELNIDLTVQLQVMIILLSQSASLFFLPPPSDCDASFALVVPELTGVYHITTTDSDFSELFRPTILRLDLLRLST